MKPFHECMDEYRTQMKKGVIREAYRGLMEYLMGLRTHFQKEFPEYTVSGNLYPGYMDMTYFSVVPDTFRRRKLKVAIVFLHETCSFEAWLAGSNKQVQAHYWMMFQESGWNRYRMPETIRGADSILEYTLAERPDFYDLISLTAQIESGTREFIRDIEDFLERAEGHNTPR